MTVVFNPLHHQAAVIVVPVVPGLTIEEVQPHSAVQRKGGSEGVCHRLLHFLPSSIRKWLSALPSVFLLSYLAPEWFTPHSPFPLQLWLWMLMRHRVAPQVGILGFQVQTFPTPQAPRDSQSYFLREPRWCCQKKPQKFAHMNTNTTPVGLQQHQTHSF